jgi:hypothetical protein
MAMAGGRSTAAQRGTATGVASPASLACRTNCVSRRLCRTTGSVDGAGGRLVLDRARGTRHGTRAAWRRANAREYARRGDPTSAVAERNAPCQPRAAGRYDGHAVGSTVGAVGVNRPKDGRTNRTQTSQMAGTAQVTVRRKKGARFARSPVDIGALGTLPVSMRRRGGGNDMARRRLLIWRPAQRTRSRPD